MPETDSAHSDAHSVDAPSFHVDRVDDTAQHQQLVDILDAQAALPSVRRLRDWALTALAVQPGERALDVGSGTGSEVFAFSRLTGPTGDAVGVDPNPTMLAVARERAAGRPFPTRFVAGTAYALPFDDDSFDVIRCERVYQHLDRPEAATAEIARVLRPGGRVMLIDSDWSTAITHPGDPDVVRALQNASEAVSPNRQSGRRLRGLLTAAGFAIDDIGSGAVVWDPDTTGEMYQMMTDRAVETGTITAIQRDRLLADLTRGVETGDYHFSVTMFAVLAHLPLH